MRIAVVSEFTADEAAVKILTDSILGIETELVAPRRSRPRGWPSLLNLLPTIIKDLHYNSNAEGLVMVVDSDETPCHEGSHETASSENATCRLCQLRVVVNRESQRLSAVANREHLKFAIGLAVPAIEAWYRAGLDPHVNEVAWGRRLSGENVSYDKQSLKKDVYGSDRPSLSNKTVAAIEAAKRLTDDLNVLEELFPSGFGSLVNDLRGW